MVPISFTVLPKYLLVPVVAVAMLQLLRLLRKKTELSHEARVENNLISKLVNILIPRIILCSFLYIVSLLKHSNRGTIVRPKVE